jgi:hypothetical protein
LGGVEETSTQWASEVRVEGRFKSNSEEFYWAREARLNYLL